MTILILKKPTNNRLGVGCVRIMHSGWSLHPHYGRRDSDGAPNRDHIPGRPASCQGRHRRGSDTRGPGRSPASRWVGPWIKPPPKYTFNKEINIWIRHCVFWFQGEWLCGSFCLEREGGIRLHQKHHIHPQLPTARGRGGDKEWESRGRAAV